MQNKRVNTASRFFNNDFTTGANTCLVSNLLFYLQIEPDYQFVCYDIIAITIKYYTFDFITII